MAEYIDKLEYLLEQYEKTKLTNFIFGIFIIAFNLMLVHSYKTTILLIIIMFVGYYIYKTLGITTKEPYMQKEDIAYSVCFLMESMIDYAKNGPRTEERILLENHGKREDLYDEFISLFPSYKSRKLKKLVTINRKK